MALDGRILFRDSNHVNILGSQRIGAALAERLALSDRKFAFD
jgi:hypothetical protein